MAERYNVIRPTVARDFYEAVGAPEWAKFKIVFKKSKAGTLPGEFEGTQFYKSRAEANQALKAKQKFILESREAKKKPAVPPKKDKFLVKVGKPIKENNVIKQKFEEVIGSKNVPSTYKKTGVVKDLYKAQIVVGDKTVLSTDFGTKADATGAVEKYRKVNPIKNPPPDLKTLNEQKKKRYLDKQAKSTAIKSKGGYYGGPHKGTVKAHLGHTGNVFGIEAITGDRLAYTPAEINQAMSAEGKGLDSKIRKVSEKIEKLKKQNIPAARKKKLLEQADALLVRLASQSQGFKKATLSTNKTFGGDRLTIDMFDEFPGWTEREINEFVKNWKDEKIITEEMVRKNPSLKVTPPDEVENIKKANFFEMNRKNALKAAEKIGKTEQTKVITELSRDFNFEKPFINAFIQQVKKNGGCPIIASGQASGGVANQTCEDIIRQDPDGSAKKIIQAQGDTPKLGKLKGVAQRFLSILPKIGTPGKIAAGAVAGGAAIGALTYNKELGEFVNPLNDDKASQATVTEWIKDNPVKTVAGTSIGFSTQEIPGAYKKARELGRGRVRSALGITGALKPVLTTFGTPAMTALFEAPFAAKRLEEGETMTEVLTDPLGPALGLSLMETLSQKAGVVRDAPKRTMAEGLKNYFNLSNVGTARPGVTSKILRMGMSPRMIAGASRFLGLPGLALSLGLTGYGAYKNYQNEEGMLYNLFNKNE